MRMKKRYKPCLQCNNCLYIGEGDFYVTSSSELSLKNGAFLPVCIAAK